ncbi:unnamed protein product [Schistocephalus solidus]|uniref:MADS-box domain-containing protein n=1 Tax=Schistocephalus solidus TaxID=70667 RepID=A0A3P7CPK3_SCHSO|nr:unnamed protein product [Schistocephalus solidus]
MCADNYGQLLQVAPDVEEVGSERHPKFTLRKLTRGKQKIPITFMHDRVRRCSTFSKRKNGLMKKAHELSELTGADVLLVVASPTNHVYTYFTKRLRGMVMSDEGRDLIYSCLGATQPAGGGGVGKDASGQTTPLCSSTSSPTPLDEDQPPSRVSSSPTVEGELQQAVVVPAIGEQIIPPQSASTFLHQLKPSEKPISPLLNSPQPLTVSSTGLTLPTLVFTNAGNAHAIVQTSAPSAPMVSSVPQTSVLYGASEPSHQALEPLVRLQDVTHFLQLPTTASGSPDSLPSRLVIPVRVLQGVPNSLALSTADDGHSFSSGSHGLTMQMQIQAQTNANSK